MKTRHYLPQSLIAAKRGRHTVQVIVQSWSDQGRVLVSNPKTKSSYRLNFRNPRQQTQLLAAPLPQLK